MKNNSSMRFVVRFNATPMRRFALLSGGFVVIPLLLAACSRQQQAKVPQKPHVCQYEKVEGRFRHFDNIGYFLDVKGRKNEIRITSPGREFDLFLALKADIGTVLSVDPEKDNKIFAICKLSTCSHYEPPQNAGGEFSMTAGYSEERLRKEFTMKNFILEGWYIKKPFKERQSEGDTMAYIKRTALKSTDFELHGYLENTRRPTQDELKKHVR